MPWQWLNRSKARQSFQERCQQDTERIAFELYQNRLLLGRAGDEHSDWENASQIVRNPIKTALFASNRPLIKLRKPTAKVGKFIARDIPEWLLFSLPKLEWMKLLAVPLAITLAGSVISRQVQREANQNSALKAYFDQLEKLTFERELLANKPKTGAIPLARGRTVAALRELDYERRKQLIAFLQASELTKVKEEGKEPVISFSRQDLTKLDLHDINLSSANLSDAYLSGADLSGANLIRANLMGAYLDGAYLNSADLINADLSSAYLSDADLSGAYLRGANLIDANLRGAYLNSADLSGADLSLADLNGADLSYANLSDANLSGADLIGANGLTKEQLENAYLCKTTLPKEIGVDPNRDCKKLGIDPQTGESIP